jgi:hypothetical protein
MIEMGGAQMFPPGEMIEMGGPPMNAAFQNWT